MEVVLSVLICFLSVYGIFQLLYNVACYISKGGAVNPDDIHMVIPVTNKSCNIEAYIRYLAIKEENESVILLNMADDAEILNTIYILASEFDFVEIMSYDEYIDYVKKKNLYYSKIVVLN